jgi:hypothetical protein
VNNEDFLISEAVKQNKECTTENTENTEIN